MHKKFVAALVAATLVPASAQAVSVKVSGHVNRAVRFVDDGVDSDIQHVDNDASRTRLQWRGSEKLGGGTAAGIYVEIGLASNRSSGVAPKAADTGDSFSGTSSDIRHSALYFAGAFGTLWLGHTSTAFKDVMTADLSGTYFFNSIGQDNLNGSSLRNSATGAVVTDIGRVSNELDGLRSDTIKYVSPNLGPAQLTVSHQNDDEWSAGSNITAGLGGGKFEARLAYEDSDNRKGFSSFGGSASYLFSQGTNVSLAYVHRDNVGTGGLESDYWRFKLGHKWANNAVALGYYTAENMAVVGDETNEFDVSFVHVLPGSQVELYAVYKLTEYDRPGLSVEDANLLMLGSRIKF